MIQSQNGDDHEDRAPSSKEKLSHASRQRHSTKKQIVVARHQPLLRAVPTGAHGGVQGFEWFRQSMRRDEDGDYAVEFLEESQEQHRVDGGRLKTDHAVKHRRVNQTEGLRSTASNPAGDDTTLALIKAGNVTVLEE